MNQKHWFLRLVLGSIFIGHFITGLLTFISGKKAIRVGSKFYGANFEPTDQFEYIIRPLGVYMLSLAFLQAMALLNPQRYKAVIDVTILVFFLRQFQRLKYAPEVYNTFGITPRQHWPRTIYFLALSLLLLLARLKMEPKH
jgi:hypothetical protein